MQRELISLLHSEVRNACQRLGLTYRVAEHAPDTFETLTEHSSVSRELIIWPGGSKHAIYKDASVNYAFRAWHDALHLQLQAGFDLSGETRVAMEQARQCSSDIAAAIMLTEVIGQAEYFKKYGEFPENQIDFVLNHYKEYLR